MCYAGNCHPECDGCKPKYVFCPKCETRTFLERKECPFCGAAISEADKDKAIEEWKRSHIGRY